PSTYSPDRLTPLAGGIRDGAHPRGAPPPHCPGSAPAHSVARVRPWPTISGSGSRCSSRRTSTGSPADAVRRSPRHGQDIPVESILPHGHLLPQREVLQRQLAVRANRASQCPKDNSQPSDHDQPIADQSGQRKIVATDEFLEGTTRRSRTSSL